MKTMAEVLEEFQVDHNAHYEMMLKQAWDRLRSKSVFNHASMSFNEQAYHRRADGKRRNQSKLWASKLPRGVWLRRIKKKHNTYLLTVYIEKINNTVTVTAQGKTCPYNDLLLKVHVFL
jgi:hypothetical protein